MRRMRASSVNMTRKRLSHPAAGATAWWSRVILFSWNWGVPYDGNTLIDIKSASCCMSGFSHLPGEDRVSGQQAYSCTEGLWAACNDDAGPGCSSVRGWMRTRCAICRSAANFTGKTLGQHEIATLH